MSADSPPLVSVLMLTYNHRDFLAEAIEGVLAQRCTFPVELLIGDDGSTDGTRDVALAYQAGYPDIVRVVGAGPNIGMNANFRRLVSHVRGQYVAYCEGDDVWCFPGKLQAQVALFESDPGLGMVHTDWVRMSRRGGTWRLHPRSQLAGVPSSLLAGKLFGSFHLPVAFRTCTVMVPSRVLDECEATPLRSQDYRFIDTVHAALVTSKWRVAYLPAICAIYRESENSALRSGVAARIRYLRSALEFDTQARGYFPPRGGYPGGYRWEMAFGLLLWGIKGRDRRAVVDAWSDLRRHFSFIEMLACAARSVWLRRRVPWRRAAVLPEWPTAGRLDGLP